MTNSHISESEFVDLCARVLRVPAGAVSLATARGELQAWDSIAHLRLVMEAEAACGAEIPLARIPEIRTLGELYESLRARHDAAPTNVAPQGGGDLTGEA